MRPSKRDTCETQQQVAEQSSKLDTITTGKETVYKADCAPGGGAGDAPAGSRPPARTVASR